jgi:hypothetical protein
MTPASRNMMLLRSVCAVHLLPIGSSWSSQTIRRIPALIIPRAQSAQGIPQVRYIVQSLVDTPIRAAL